MRARLLLHVALCVGGRRRGLINNRPRRILEARRRQHAGSRAFRFMELYPVHLQFRGRTALIVGGGPIAAAKAKAVHEGGAQVRVIARTVSAEMQKAVAELGLSCEQREFRHADLEDVWLVIGATNDPALHRRIFEEARQRRILVCIVDDPEHSDFIVPAVLKRGELVVTISTSGVAPAYASRIRDYLGEIIGDSYGQALDELKAARAHIKERYPDFEDRRRVWYELLDQHVLPALRTGKDPEIERYFETGKSDGQ